MNLNYARLEMLLRHLHGVVPEKGGALKARLIHFQRAKFPPNVNVGRGGRAIYGAEETFALIFAFELLRMRVPPLTAVQIISANWPLFRQMLLVGWRAWIDARQPPPADRSMAASNDSSPGGRPVAIFVTDGLEDLRRQGRPSGEFDRVEIVKRHEIASWLNNEGPLICPALQILDFMSVVGRALDAVVALGFDDPTRERAIAEVRLNEMIHAADAEHGVQ